jgi:hypothetical protein
MLLISFSQLAELFATGLAANDRMISGFLAESTSSLQAIAFPPSSPVPFSL